MKHDTPPCGFRSVWSDSGLWNSLNFGKLKRVPLIRCVSVMKTMSNFSIHDEIRSEDKRYVLPLIFQKHILALKIFLSSLFFKKATVSIYTRPLSLRQLSILLSLKQPSAEHQQPLDTAHLAQLFSYQVSDIRPLLPWSYQV